MSDSIEAPGTERQPVMSWRTTIMLACRNIGLNIICMVLGYSLVWGILYLHFAPDRSPLDFTRRELFICYCVANACRLALKRPISRKVCCCRNSLLVQMLTAVLFSFNSGLRRVTTSRLTQKTRQRILKIAVAGKRVCQVRANNAQRFLDEMIFTCRVG